MRAAHDGIAWHSPRGVAVGSSRPTSEGCSATPLHSLYHRRATQLGTLSLSPPHLGAAPAAAFPPTLARQTALLQLPPRSQHRRTMAALTACYGASVSPRCASGQAADGSVAYGRLRAAAPRPAAARSQLLSRSPLRQRHLGRHAPLAVGRSPGEGGGETGNGKEAAAWTPLRSLGTVCAIRPPGQSPGAGARERVQQGCIGVAVTRVALRRCDACASLCVHRAVVVFAATDTDIMELTEENVERVLDEVRPPPRPHSRLGRGAAGSTARPPQQHAPVPRLACTCHGATARRMHRAAGPCARPRRTHPRPLNHNHQQQPLAGRTYVRCGAQVRPYLMSDGGNVEFVEIDGLVVKLKLKGACGSCPSSTATMTMGIKRRLMEKIPVRLPCPRLVWRGSVGKGGSMRPLSAVAWWWIGRPGTMQGMAWLLALLSPKGGWHGKMHVHAWHACSRAAMQQQQQQYLRTHACHHTHTHTSTQTCMHA